MPIFQNSGFKLKYQILLLLISGVLLLTLGSSRLWAQGPSDDLGWKSFGLEGDIAYAPVRLDGYELFSIATSLPEEAGSDPKVKALQIRRDRIENRLKNQLQTLLDQGVDPDEIAVITTLLNQQVTLQVLVEGEAGRPIITVTALDAEIYGLTEAELGEEFAQRIQTGLVRGIVERQPAAQWSQLKQALVGGAIATLLITLLWLGRRWLRQSRQRLRQQLLAQQNSLDQQQIALDPEDLQPTTLTDQRHQIFDLKQRIEGKTWQSRLLQLAILGSGLMGVGWILQRFPQTRPQGILLVKQPLGLLIIGLMITLAILGSRLAVDWALAKWVSTQETLASTQVDRRRRRAITLSEVWKTVLTALWLTLGVVLVVSLLTLSSGWNLTIQLGAVGLILSLALQSAIKDALAGFFLLAKDAYVVGDLITVKDLFGVVESVGLYLTQIRNSAGGFVTLRNGEITTVINHSHDWARMDLIVWVDHDTDLKQALNLMLEVFQALQVSPNWAPQLLDQPDILGVDQVDTQGFALKIRAQTAPGQQWGVAREYRLRLNQAFKAAGIRFAIPQREVRYRH